jgi:hypothetical protein
MPVHHAHAASSPLLLFLTIRDQPRSAPGACNRRYALRPRAPQSRRARHRAGCSGRSRTCGHGDRAGLWGRRVGCVEVRDSYKGLPGLPRHAGVGGAETVAVPWRFRVGGAEKAEPATEALHQAGAGHVEVVERIVAGWVERGDERHDEPSTMPAMNSVASDPTLNCTWPAGAGAGPARPRPPCRCSRGSGRGCDPTARATATPPGHSQAHARPRPAAGRGPARRSVAYCSAVRPG